MAFDDRVAWIQRYGGVHAAAIDVDTGATRVVTVEAHELGRGAVVPTGGGIDATVRRHAAVEGFNAASDASMREAQRVICDEHVWTLQGKRLVGIRRSNGRTVRDLAVPENASIIAGRTEVILVEDLVTPNGIRTRLHAIDGRDLRELATFDGEIIASESVATRDLFLARLWPEPACIVVDLTSGAEVLLVDGLVQCAALDHVAVISQHGAITVVSRGSGELCMQRISLAAVSERTTDDPTISAPMASVAVGMRAIVASLESRLFILDLCTIPWRDADLEFVPITQPGMSEPLPATVLFAGAQRVVTEHPRLARVVLRRNSPTPPLAKGDLVVFDEMREAAPGKFTVVRWHKQGEPPRATASPVVFLRASGLAPMPPERPPFAADSCLPALQTAAKTLGFAIAPVLERFLALHDSDLGFRGLLNRVSILVEVTGGTTAWSGSDPCMLGLAGNGEGDVVSFYYYPPAHTPGAELPIVQWLHEDNTVEWVAQSFEVYLASCLRDAEKWSKPVVQAIRTRLDFPARAAKKAKAPDWFLASHGRKRRGRLDDDDDVARERSLVRVLRDSREDEAAKSALLRVYERLGWRWHAEQLRTAG